VFLLTDRRLLAPGRDLLEQVAGAVAGGAGAVLVRERDLPESDRRELGRRLAASLSARPPQGRERAEPVLGWAAPAPSEHPAWHLLHLRAVDQVPTPRPLLLGRSCHEIADLRRAAAEGCDYVTVSPVAESLSKPGYGPALGPEGLRALLERAAYQGITVPPVLALGGVTPGNARSFLRAGAHGVAVMGGFMRSENPGALAESLWEAVAA
jgi:thiamine-phosphate pyrophosphorylase